MVKPDESNSKNVSFDKNHIEVNKISDENENTSEFIVKYRGETYEISNFLKHHPGGRQTFKAYKGLALDSIFDDVKHSEAAFHLFNQFKVNNERTYEDIERLVDWNTPLLSQVGLLSNKYWEWVNLPVNRPIRLFQSDYLEMLTNTPWYAVPLVWIPISVYFLYLGLMKNISGPLHYSICFKIFSFLLGVLIWTLIEYTLHRRIFHLKPPASSKLLISLHFILHGIHHKAPFDDRRLVFPPIAGILVAFIFYQAYKIFIPSIIIDTVAAGTMIGYLCYDLIHYYLHYGKPSSQSYFYEMKRYHNYHHFSHHESGFGISSKLWDYFFKTVIILRQLKKAIVW